MVKSTRSRGLAHSFGGEVKAKPARQSTATKKAAGSGQPAHTPTATRTCTRSSSAASAQTQGQLQKAGDTGAQGPRAVLQPSQDRKRQSTVDAEEVDGGRPVPGAGKENKRVRRASGGEQSPSFSQPAASPAFTPPSPLKAPTSAPGNQDARGIEARQSGVGAGAPAPVLPATAESFQPWNRDHVAMVLDVLLDANATEERRNSNKNSSSSSSSSSAGRDPGTSKAQHSSTATPPGAAAAPHGRQQHFLQLHSMLAQCRKEGMGRSVYISGLPGTGKSHTVHAVLSALKEQDAQPPHTVFLSCFGLRDPSEVHRALYSECERALSGPMHAAASSHDAHQQLVRLLQTCSKPAQQKSDAKKKRSRMFVLVLDEVDRLLLKGADDLHKLFMLPHEPGVCCCVIAMANSIDITERSLPALRCRGCAPDFIPFTTYSRPQVLSILTAKLAHLPWPVFHDQALELVARKVCSSTGDLRKVFQACRFALTSLHEKMLSDIEGQNHADGTGTKQPQQLPPSQQQQEQQQQQPADQHGLSHLHKGYPSTAGMLVNVSHMAAALARLSYQAGSGASHASTIRCLPQQQQLHLLALATTVATAASQAAAATAAEAAAQEHGLTSSAYRTKYYWGPSVPGLKPARASNPFAADPQRSAAGIAAAAATGAGAGDHQRVAATGASKADHRFVGGSSASEGGRQGLQGQQVGSQGQQACSLSRQQQGAGEEDSGASDSVVKQGAVSDSRETGKTESRVQSSQGGGSAGRRSSIGSSAELCAGDAACSVLLRDAYEQYRRLALQTFQHPASEQEFKSTMQLLSQTGLVSVHPASDHGAKRTISSEQRCAGKAKQGDVSLALKVQMKDIHTALRDSVLFKRVLSGLPA